MTLDHSADVPSANELSSVQRLNALLQVDSTTVGNLQEFQSQLETARVDLMNDMNTLFGADWALKEDEELPELALAMSELLVTSRELVDTLLREREDQPRRPAGFSRHRIKPGEYIVTGGSGFVPVY